MRDGYGTVGYGVVSKILPDIDFEGVARTAKLKKKSLAAAAAVAEEN